MDHPIPNVPLRLLEVFLYWLKMWNRRLSGGSSYDARALRVTLGHLDLTKVLIASPSHSILLWASHHDKREEDMEDREKVAKRKRERTHPHLHPWPQSLISHIRPQSRPRSPMATLAPASTVDQLSADQSSVTSQRQPPLSALTIDPLESLFMAPTVTSTH